MRASSEHASFVGGDARLLLDGGAATMSAPDAVSVIAGRDVTITGNGRVLLGAPPVPMRAEPLRMPERVRLRADFDLDDDEEVEV